MLMIKYNADEARAYIEQTDSPIVIEGYYHTGKHSVNNRGLVPDLSSPLLRRHLLALLIDTETFTGVNA